MPSTDWAKIESSLLDISAFTSVVDGIGDTLDAAKTALEVSRAAMDVAFDTVIPDAVSIAIDTVSEALNAATAPLRLDGAIHVILLPAGEYGYEGITEALGRAFNDTDDLNRPNFDPEVFVAGAMLLGTADTYHEVVGSALRMAAISANPNRAVLPLRMTVQGLPAYGLPVPQNIIAAPYRKNGACAVRVLWDPEHALGTTVRKIDIPVEAFTINGVKVIRSTVPLARAYYDETAFPQDTVVFDIPFAGVDKPQVYSDEDVEEDTVYYYTVCYTFTDATGDTLGPFYTGNSARVETKLTPDYPLTFHLPYWITVEGGLNALFPDVAAMTDYVQRFINGYIDAGGGRAENAGNIVSSFIDEEIARLDSYSSELDALSAKVASVAAPWPSGAIASFTFTSGGISAEIFTAISTKLYDDTDENRPDLTDRYSYALLLIAGSPTAAAALAAQSVFSLLVSGEDPAPSPGLDEAIASLGSAVDNLAVTFSAALEPL